jgi:hypothetical protein
MSTLVSIFLLVEHFLQPVLRSPWDGACAVQVSLGYVLWAARLVSDKLGGIFLPEAR